MKERDNSKIHISSNFLLSMSSNNVRHLITRTIITLQHFATLHPTSPNYTSLHLSTLHFLSFTLHYPLIWLNPFTFPTYRSVSPHVTKLDTVQFSRLQTYFPNNEPLPCPKETLTISLHSFFFHLSYQPFYSPYFDAWWNAIGRVKPTQYGEILSHCLSIHHNSHTHWLRNETGTPR
jgi:hypothetical protein